MTCARVPAAGCACAGLHGCDQTTRVLHSLHQAAVGRSLGSNMAGFNQLVQIRKLGWQQLKCITIRCWAHVEYVNSRRKIVSWVDKYTLPKAFICQEKIIPVVSSRAPPLNVEILSLFDRCLYAMQNFSSAITKSPVMYNISIPCQWLVIDLEFLSPGIRSSLYRLWPDDIHEYSLSTALQMPAVQAVHGDRVIVSQTSENPSIRGLRYIGWLSD